MNRKQFLSSLIGSSIAFSGISRALGPNSSQEIEALLSQVQQSVDGSMIGFRAAPIAKVKIGLIGCGNRGQSLIQMLALNVDQGNAEVVGLCDILQNNVDKVNNHLKEYQKKEAKLYVGEKDHWQQMIMELDLDLVIICTPWRYHAPMSIFAMENDVHVASEVPIAYTIEDCWKIVKTAEETRKHCIMMENCCYNEEELWLLNMVAEGVFGDITHTEGAYLHDLRAHMLSEDYYQGQWRLKQHIDRDGNFYTTHGLGPCSMYLNIGRGDAYDYLSSMSSRELNLSQTAKRLNAKHQSFACGDLNTTMIKTKKGKTIMLQFDVHTGRPYSRINKLVGTKAVHDGYPSKLFIDGDELVLWGHKWLEEEEYESYRLKYRHPIINKLKTISEGFKQGHGGMDFVMIYRLIDCLNNGKPLDLNVYDGVMWSAITPLSELSVADRSASIDIPDFTGGLWKQEGFFMNDKM